ncbi:hypothetical protein Taro_019023 [Colocasia esculenta]|uniref:60S ribosomal protein L27 n=1 Tax=Colocasia esculenta TaxID=4460 RepID=A0A843USV9_COLES|nr:hypothetical protein [Colocasia esculenta]
MSWSEVHNPDHAATLLHKDWEGGSGHIKPIRNPLMQARAGGGERGIEVEGREGEKGRGAKMVKFLKSNKAAVIVKNFDDGTHDRAYGHCLVVGIYKYPKKVIHKDSAKKTAKKSRVKAFVKLINYNHIMPTRYTLDVDLKDVVTPDVLQSKDKKVTACKETKAPVRGALQDGMIVLGQSIKWNGFAGIDSGTARDTAALSLAPSRPVCLPARSPRSVVAFPSGCVFAVALRCSGRRGHCRTLSPLSLYGIALVRERFRVSWLYPGRRSSDPIAPYSGGDTFSKDFGMALKHRKGSISLDDLMRAIAIEEEHRKEKPGMPVEASANLMVKYKNKDDKVKPKTGSTTQMKPKGKI